MNSLKNDFVSRFFALASARSPLCVGIDPSRELLQAWGLSNDPNGLRTFCHTVLDAAGDLVAVIKPQSAFFEQFGWQGMKELAEVTARIRQQGALSLIDCKRGDIGTTLDAYGLAFLGEHSPFGADAVTVSPYLGLDALKPLFERAVSLGAGAFVVVRSSNPEGVSLQEAQLADGRMVAASLADGITRFNRQLGASVGPIGAVMGATLTPATLDIIARLPNSLLLAPGIGAQGATFNSLLETFGQAALRVLPSVSRGVLASGPSESNLRAAIARLRDDAQRMIERARLCPPLPSVAAE